MKTVEVLDQILAQRGKTHGDFTDNAQVSQDLKQVVEASVNWDKLSAVQKEAIHMILHKISRIVSGNANEPDHYDDIAGYATLAKDRLPS